MTLSHRIEGDESLENLSNEQLSELMSKCQTSIADGSAQIEDYEAFVLCQKELARRTWS